MSLLQNRVRVLAFSLDTSDVVTGDADNITAKWAKDFGVPVALTDVNPVEAQDGFYYFDLTDEERNLTMIGELFPVSSTPQVKVISIPGALESNTEIALNGDWGIIRVFENILGDTITGVRMSLVGVYGKVSTSTEGGICQINVNNGIYVLRITVPIGFESVPDQTVNINEGNDQDTIVLAPIALPSVTTGLCVLQLYLRSQGTTEIIPLMGVNVTAKMVTDTKAVGSVLYVNVKDNTITDANGYAQLVLVQDTTYDLSLTFTNSVHIKKIRVNIPIAGSATISEVI